MPVAYGVHEIFYAHNRTEYHIFSDLNKKAPFTKDSDLTFVLVTDAPFYNEIADPEKYRTWGIEVSYGVYIKPFKVTHVDGGIKVAYKAIAPFYIEDKYTHFGALTPDIKNYISVPTPIMVFGYTDYDNVMFKTNSIYRISEDEAMQAVDLFETFGQMDDAFSSSELPSELNSIPHNTFQTDRNTNKGYTISYIKKLIKDSGDQSVPGSKEYKRTLFASIFNFISSDFIKLRGIWSCLTPIYFVPVDQIVLELLSRITEEVNSENDIKTRMNKRLGNQQKEFVLREKMRAIQDMLSELQVPLEEDDYARALKDPVLSQRYPESIKTLIKDETKRASEMMQASPEASIARTYISLLKKLPWRVTEREFLDINRAQETLDKHHYGLEKIKERILEYLAVLINLQKIKDKQTTKIAIPGKPSKEIDLSLFKEDDDSKKTYNNVPILTLIGPPGTGKTSLAKSIAEALGREFIKVSLGGVHDEAEIRGHRRTYVGAMPGKIIKAMNKVGVSNPVILLDEIDKMASDMKGDPASAMLEVLDPEQNANFQDHYLEHEYDLSKCVFIATANYIEGIPHALLDRVELIELQSYTLSEKVHIARNHLIAKVLEQTGLDDKKFSISDETLKYIIKHYTQEAGVRGLKRILDQLARKIILKSMKNKKLKSFEIKIDELTELLGVIKYKEDTPEEILDAGVVNGLAYTPYGGSTLQIEVTTYPGKGELKLTGSLKEVMQESAQIAITYVRANAEKFGIKDFDFETNTIHIHVPEGAVPKDGPSAGVTFTTAIISALSNRPVLGEYGMTGEITLTGKVLPIGGLAEKSFAAVQKQLKTIFIPHENIRNLKDVSDEVKSELVYVPVKKYEDIYNVIFLGKKPEEKITFKLEK
ncbi:endopeptidase La [Mycoplasma sp. Pen4]|nr:endopeptidase La [Mycoplasma sp. Pen4]